MQKVKIFFRRFADWIITAISSILSYLITFVFNPLFFTSVLGPTIVERNFKIMVKLMKIDHPEVTQATEDIYTYALTSYHVQLLVLILSCALFISETFTMIKKLMKNHSLEQLKPFFHTSVLTKFICLVAFAIFVSFIFNLSTASYAQIDINLYLEKNAKYFLGGIPFPPIKSLITKYRIVFGLYGLILAFWENKTLPKLLLSAKSSTLSQ
jgi:hypothetical protein